MLTTKQAAQRLNLAERTVRAHIKAGSLHATRVGRDWVLQSADVDQFKVTKRRPGRPQKDLGSYALSRSTTV